MFADDEKNEMDEQEQDAEQPEKESFDAEATILDSMPAVEAAPAEEEEPPAPETEEPAKAEEAAEQADDAWVTVAAPAKKAEGSKAEKKEKPATQPPKAEFAPTTPLEAVGAAESGSESKVPLGDFLSNLGIKDQTWQIVVLVAAGLILLCCVCSCLGLAVSAALGGNY